MRGAAVAFCFNAPRFVPCLGPLIAGTLIAYFGGFGMAATLRLDFLELRLHPSRSRRRSAIHPVPTLIPRRTIVRGGGSTGRWVSEPSMTPWGSTRACRQLLQGYT
jgi:hypothetical protein